MDLGQQRYLNRADQFADQADELFLDNCPLPRASHAHAHYEANKAGEGGLPRTIQNRGMA